jgi:hypothetical protein
MSGLGTATENWLKEYYDMRTIDKKPTPKKVVRIEDELKEADRYMTDYITVQLGNCDPDILSRAAAEIRNLRDEISVLTCPEEKERW